MFFLYLVSVSRVVFFHLSLDEVQTFLSLKTGELVGKFHMQEGCVGRMETEDEGAWFY